MGLGDAIEHNANAIEFCPVSVDRLVRRELVQEADQAEDRRPS